MGGFVGVKIDRPAGKVSADHRATALEDRSMRDFIFRFLSDRRGATAIEYALLAGGIALSIVAAVGLLGDELATFFEDVQTQLAAM